VIEILKSQRVLTSDGLRPACIQFRDGRIFSIGSYETFAEDESRVLDVGNYYVLPGLVDSHVHVNEPGRTHWEGFATATAAAAAGGCTCIIDMPLNSIPATTTVEALRCKREAASKQCLVDYGFWGGVVPGNSGEIFPLAKNGVCGFKCFLAESGVDEFTRVSESDLHVAMPFIAETGLPLLVHAEVPGPLLAAQKQVQNEDADWRQYPAYLRSRPAQAEVDAVELMIRLCRKYSCRVHIVHVSSAEVLPLLKQARSEGLPITAETCPHYLYFAAEGVPIGATQFKCAPPIRDDKNRELLWDGLASGVLDFIATDHSPCPPEMKKMESGNFNDAWGGIASLSVALPVIWSAARRRGFEIADVCRWMSTNPARLAGFEAHKGQIAVRGDADFVVFDPDGSVQVTADRLHFRHALSPYLGEQLRGEVRQVFVRGCCVYDQGRLASERAGREVSPARQLHVE
jgi:allantoinase